MIQSSVLSSGKKMMLLSSSSSRQRISRIISMQLQRQQQQHRRTMVGSVQQATSVGMDGTNDDIDWEENKQFVLKSMAENEDVRNTMTYSLSMATSDGSKFPSFPSNQLDKRMQEQIEFSKDQLLHNVTTEESDAIISPSWTTSTSSSVDNRPLPKTLQDALRPTSRAVVVTEIDKPFRVLNVNDAWEDLCGYSYLESKGKSLGELLKGPETDQGAVTALLNQLLRGEDAATVLVNYTKTGRKFYNRLRVGPLYNESGTHVTHFVGILKEVPYQQQQATM